MKIAIFSIGTNEAKQRIAACARAQGHEAKVGLFLSNDDRAWLETSDILIVRFFSNTYNLARETVAWYQRRNPNGLVSTSAEDIKRSFDKYLSYQVLRSAGISTPDTRLIQTIEDIDDLGDKLPLIVKPRGESQGKGIVVVHTLDALREHTPNMLKEYGSFIAQDFVAEAAGRDIRAFVIGDQVVAAMERQAPEGSHLANLSKGGMAVPIQLDEETKELAIATNRAFRTEFSGIDLLHTKHGPTVIEINASPGFKLADIANIDLGTKVIEHMVNKRKMHS